MPNTESALIEIVGTNDERWTVSGPGMGSQGVELDISPEGLHDEAPFKTIWQQTAFQEGATYVGTRIEPLDLVLAFNIWGEDGHHWEEIESRFLGGFDFKAPATIEYTSMGETRTLEVVKLEKSKTISKHDPRIGSYSRVIMTLRAPWPFWEGDTVVSMWKGSGSGAVTVENPTDRPMWLKWVCSAPGRWTLPDYDWSFAGKDSKRTITTPTLSSSQTLTIDTYPLTESYVARDGSNIAGRFNGVEFLYPVPKHTPPTELPVSVTGGGGQSTVSVRMVQYWSRPWGGRKNG